MFLPTLFPRISKTLIFAALALSSAPALAADGDATEGGQHLRTLSQLFYDTKCYDSANGTLFSATSAGVTFTYTFTTNQLQGFVDSSSGLVVGLCSVPAPDVFNLNGYVLQNPRGPENCALALGNSTFSAKADYEVTERAFVDPAHVTALGLPFNLSDVALACQGANDDGVTNLRAQCIYNFMVLEANAGAGSKDAFAYCIAGGGTPSKFVGLGSPHYSGASDLKSTFSAGLVTAITLIMMAM